MWHRFGCTDAGFYFRFANHAMRQQVPRSGMHRILSSAVCMYGTLLLPKDAGIAKGQALHALDCQGTYPHACIHMYLQRCLDMHCDKGTTYCIYMCHRVSYGFTWQPPPDMAFPPWLKGMQHSSGHGRHGLHNCRITYGPWQHCHEYPGVCLPVRTCTFSIQGNIGTTSQTARQRPEPETSPKQINLMKERRPVDRVAA